MKQLSMLVFVLAFSCTEKQVYESSTTQPAAKADVSAKSDAAPAKDYSKYAGVYKMQGASFDEVAITAEEGKLYAQATGERKVEIYPEKENTFNVPAFNAKITFTDEGSEAFSGITVWLNGGELKGRKQ